jgi:RNA polymerase sigma-70 factor, ECF subfamily
MNGKQPSGSLERERVEQFMALYSSHQRRLYLYAVALLPTSADAEEVFQEANLVLWRKFHQYQLGTNFFAWACKIIRYEVLKFRRKTLQAVPILDPDVLDRLAEMAVAQIEHLDESHLRAFNDCIAKLNASDRELIDHRYTVGMTVHAIAAAAHRSPNGVSQSLARIRRLLLDCISKTIRDSERSGSQA